MNLIVVYVCVVIDHFMVSTVTAVSQYCLPVLYVRQDKTSQSTESSPVVNLSSLWAQAHHPTFAPRAPSVPHALQTQNPAAPQKRARSCSQDRTRPSLAPVSKADRSESAMRQNRLLHRTSPVAVDDREHSYAEPVYYPSRGNCDGKLCASGGKTHLIEVYFNAAHVRRAYGNHAEKPVPPAPEHRNAFIQHKQILRALRHPRRNRKQFTCRPSSVSVRSAPPKKRDCQAVNGNKKKAYLENVSVFPRPMPSDCENGDNLPGRGK